MPLTISRNDIRNVKAEIIVNPTDRFCSGSGGIDGIIHELSGEQLKDELLKHIPLEEGFAFITDSYDFNNCDYIIHTCGPHYIDGEHDEEKTLSSCYENCLSLALEKEVQSIAFPLISSGSFNFPKGRALKIATGVITSFLLDNEMDVLLLVYDRDSFDTAGKLFSDVRDYLDRRLQTELKASTSQNAIHIGEKPREKKKEEKLSSIAKEYEFTAAIEDAECSLAGGIRFEPDESFSECLVRMIDEKKLNDPDVYKRANIDRKHFNHIINDRFYRPKKETAVALAIGMKLNLKETKQLLERAGFALSDSFVFDQIIHYCIVRRIYNIFDINEILFEYDQKTLGC